MTPLKENLDRLESAIEQACRRAGRPRGDVELMAVSKTYPAATICEAASLGLRLFGENRVQEFAGKSADLAALHNAGSVAAPDDSMAIHLIGHLQSNKSARAVELFDGIDSLDSPRLAERLNDARRTARQAAADPDRSETQPGRDQGGLDPESAEARNCSSAARSQRT